MKDDSLEPTDQEGLRLNGLGFVEHYAVRLHFVLPCLDSPMPASLPLEQVLSGPVAWIMRCGEWHSEVCTVHEGEH